MNITDIDTNQTIIANINGSDYPARVLKSDTTPAGHIVVTLSYPNSLNVWDDLTVTATTTSGPWRTYFGHLPVTFRPMEYTSIRDLAQEIADSEDADPDWSALYVVAVLDLDPWAVSGDTLLDEDQAERVLNAVLDLHGIPA